MRDFDRKANLATLDISDQLRRALQKSEDITSDMEKAVTPTTKEAWHDFIKQQDAQRLKDAAVLFDRFQGEIHAETCAGVPTYRLEPNQPDPAFADYIFLHFHGGGYVFGGGESGIIEPLVMLNHIRIKVVSVDYRMPPSYPAPAACDDALCVYQDLVARYGAEHIIIGGTSAGAGLSLSLIQAALAQNIAPPAAVFLGTAWADISKASDTLYSLENVDRRLPTYHAILEAAGKLYADGRDATDPLVSPLYGSFANFPPCFLVSGTRDLLLSDTVRVHRKLRRADVRADMHIFEAHSHADYLVVAHAPETAELYREFYRFLQQVTA